MRICESTHRNGDHLRNVFEAIVNGRAARRTEVENKFVTAVSNSDVLTRLSFERDLIAGEARLNTERTAGSLLA